MTTPTRPLTLLAVTLALTLFLAACAPRATPTMFIPPAGNKTPTPTPTLTQAASPVALPTFTVPPPTVPVTATATQPALSPTPTACANDLKFDQDLTFPDGTVVQAGASVEKQWLVTNSGTCDWTSSYRLSFVGGDTLGAPADQALFPARAGMQATLTITFIAPLEAGAYQSAWQAFDASGNAFGEVVYMTIVVQ
ncbi:MAG: hypothetical protein HY869_01095 [Chloroflexi bacterium]|nr:hypothetical protein [Chloroflexota bacterium]